MSDAAVKTVKTHAKHQSRMEQLEAWLKKYTQDGRPLPRGRGDRPNISLILKLAELPRVMTESSDFHELLDKYAKKFGLGDAKKAHLSYQNGILEADSPSGNRFTYGQLLDLPLGVADKSPAHYKSALNRFIKLVERSKDDFIGPEFYGDFDESIILFTQHYYKGNKRDARSAVAALRKWREIWLSQRKIDDLPNTLQGALIKLVEYSGKTIAQLSREIDVDDSLLRRFIKGDSKYFSKHNAEKLELALRVPRGTLTSRMTSFDVRRSPNFCPIEHLPEYLRANNSTISRKRRMIKNILPEDYPSLDSNSQKELLEKAIKKMEREYYASPFSKRLANNTNDDFKYRLAEKDQPDSLQSEIKNLVEMKKRKGGFDKIHRALKWNSATAERWKLSISYFLGFCHTKKEDCKPDKSGLDIPTEEITLGLIAIPAVTDAYLDFRRARTDDEDGTTSKLFLSECIALLQPKKGWLPNHPEVFHRLPEIYKEEVIKNSGWENQCHIQINHLRELINGLDFKKTRNPFLPIMPMIETGRPLDIVKLALENNKKELLDIAMYESNRKIELALKWRDYILISLLSKIPLRAKHWQSMSYDESITSLHSFPELCNLRCDTDGNWALIIEAKDFKNKRNEDIFGPDSDRDVKVIFKEMESLKDFEKDLDFYMREMRPVLVKGDGPVFPTMNGEFNNRNKISVVVKSWTERYVSEMGNKKYGLRIKGVKPFGPHAFRHIVASHVIMTTGSYEIAANLLLDTIEMVRGHYGHLAPKHRLSLALASVDTWQKKANL
ncbi:site-specific integrase [Deinococcus sp. PESE-13]